MDCLPVPRVKRKRADDVIMSGSEHIDEDC